MAKVTGQEGIIGSLRKIANKVPASATAAMKSALLTVRREAQARTPVDVGVLKGSAKTYITKSDRRSTKGVVSYSAEYAPYVHEITKNRHNVGEAKFLSNAVKSKADDVMRIFSTYLSGAIK